TPGNWDKGVPVDTDSLLFTGAGGNGSNNSNCDITTLSGANSVLALDMTGYAGTLTFDQDVRVTGNATLRGAVVLNATLTLTGVTQSLGATTTIAAGGILQASAGGGTTTIENGTTTSVSTGAPGGLLDIDGNLVLDGTLTVTGAGALDLEGTLTGTTAFLNGTGNVNVAGGTVTLTGIAVNMTGGAFVLDGAGTVALALDTADTFNNFTNTAGGLVTVSGPAARRLTVGGALATSGTGLTLADSGAQIGGALTVNGGGNLTGSGGTLEVGGSVNFTLAGTIDLTAVATELLLSGAGPLSVTQATQSVGAVRRATGVGLVSWVGAIDAVSLRVDTGSSSVTLGAGGAISDFLDINAGTFTPSAGLSIGGDIDFTGGNLAAAGSTITLSGDPGPQLVTSAGEVFANVIVSNGTGTVQLQDTAQFGTLALTAGDFDLNGNTLTVTGATGFDGANVTIGGGVLDLNGTVSTAGAGSVVTHASGTVRASAALVGLGTVDWRGAGGGIFTLDGATQALTTPVAGGSTGFGVFNANMSALATITGTLTTQTTNVTVSTAELRMTTNTITVANNLTLTNGAVLTSTTGAVTVTGSLIQTSGNVTTGAGALTVGNALTITSGALSVGAGDADVGGNLTAGGAGSSLVLNGNQLNVAGPVANFGSLGTFTPGAGSLVTLDRKVSDGPVALTPHPTAFVGFTIDRLAFGDQVVPAVRALVATGPVNVTIGSLVATQDLAFNDAGSQVVIAGLGRINGFTGGQTVTFQGGLSVLAAGQFVIQPPGGTGGADLVFAEGSVSTFAGTAVWTVQGTSGAPTNRIRLSDGAASNLVRWTVNTAGAVVDVDFADLTDSAAPDGPTAIDSNNIAVSSTGWVFDPRVVTWTGNGGNAFWSTPGNWDKGVPVDTDSLLFTGAGGNGSNNSNCDITTLSGASSLLGLDMTGYAGTLTFAQDVRVVAGTTTLQGAVVVNATLTLSGSLVNDSALSISVGDVVLVGGNLSGGDTLGDGISGAGNMSVAGSVTATGVNSALGMSGGVFTLTGAASQALNVDTADTFPTLVVGPFGAAVAANTLTVAEDLQLNGDLILSAGGGDVGGSLQLVAGRTLTGAGGTLAVGGDFETQLTSVLAGTLPTIQLDGGALQTVRQNGIALVDVTVNNAVGATWISSLLLTGNLTVLDGSITLPPGHNRLVNLDMSAGTPGTLTTLAGAGNQLQVLGDWNVAGATAFAHNGTAVIFSGTQVAQTVDPGPLAATQFAGLTVDKQGGDWLNTGNPLSAAAVVFNGAVALNASVTATSLTVGAGTLDTTGQALTVNGLTTLSGDVTVGTGSVLTFNSNVTATAGTVTMTALTNATVNFDGLGATINLGAGTFTGSGGLVTFGGQTGMTLQTNGTTFPNVQIDVTVPVTTVTHNAGTALVIGGTLTLNGTLTLGGAGPTTVANTVTVNSGGVLNATVQDFTITGANDLQLDGRLNCAPSRSVTVGGSFDGTGAASNLQIAGGTLSVAGANADFATLNTVNWGAGGFLILNSGVPQALLPRTAVGFSNLTVNSSSVVTVPQAGVDFTVSSALLVQAGTLTLERSMTVAGAATINGVLTSTNNNGGDTLQFQGGLTIAGAGSAMTVEQLANGAGVVTLIFNEGTTWNVSAVSAVTLTGLDGDDFVLLRDQNAGSDGTLGTGLPGPSLPPNQVGQWLVNSKIVMSISICTIQDSEALLSGAPAGLVQVPTSSINGGGNDNWSFPGGTKIFTAAIDNNWSTAGNWIPTPPTQFDFVEFANANAASLSVQDVAGLQILGLDLDGNSVGDGDGSGGRYQGTLRLDQDLIVNGAVVLQGVTNLNGRTLTVGGASKFVLLSDDGGTLNTGTGVLNVIGGTSSIEGVLNIDSAGQVWLGGNVLSTSNGTIDDGGTPGSLTFGGTSSDLQTGPLAVTLGATSVAFVHSTTAQSITLGGATVVGSLSLPIAPAVPTTGLGAATPGPLTLNGAGGISSAGTVFLGANLVTNGLNFTAGGLTTINPGATLVVNGGAGTVSLNGNVAAVAGNITQGTNTTIQIPSGTVDLAALGGFAATGPNALLSLNGAAQILAVDAATVTINDLTIAAGADMNDVGTPSTGALNVTGTLTTSAATTLPNFAANVVNDLVMAGTLNTTNSFRVVTTAVVNGVVNHGVGNLDIDGSISSGGGGVINVTAASNALFAGALLNFDANLTYNQTGTGLTTLNRAGAQTLEIAGAGDVFQNLTTTNTSTVMTGSTAPLNVTGLLTVGSPMTLNPAGAASTLGALTLATGANGDAFANTQGLSVGGGAVALTRGQLQVNGGTTNLGSGALTTNVQSSVTTAAGTTLQLGAPNLPLSTLSAFTPNNASLVQLTGANPTMTITAAVVGLGNLTVDNGVTLSGDDLIVNTNLTLTAGTLTAGSTDVSVTADVTLVAAASVLLAGTGDVTAGGNLTGGGTLNLAGNSNATVSGNFTPGGFVKGLPPGVLTLSTGGALNWGDAGGADFGQVRINGGGTVTQTIGARTVSNTTALAVSAASTLELGGFNLTASGQVSVTGGASLDATAGVSSLSLTGTGGLSLAGSAPLTAGNNIDVGFSGAAAQALVTNNQTFRSLIVSKGGGAVSGSGNLVVVGGGLRVNLGTLNWTAGNLTSDSRVDLSGGTFTMPTASTFTMNPGAPVTFDVGSNALQGNLAISGTSTTQVVNSLVQVGTGVGNRRTLTVNTGATLDSDASMTVWGAVTINTGSIWLLGQPAIVIRFGDDTAGTGPTHNFVAGARIDIENSNDCSFFSTLDGIQWKLDNDAAIGGAGLDLVGAGAPPPIQGLKVRDSNASFSSVIPLTGGTAVPGNDGTGVNFGGNTNWPDIRDVQSTWTGLGVGIDVGDWAAASNWTPIAPVAGTILIFNVATPANLPLTNSPSFSLSEIRIFNAFAGAVTISQDMTILGPVSIGTGSSFVTAANVLTVTGGTVSGTGTLNAATSPSVSVAGLTVATYTKGTLLTFTGVGTWFGTGLSDYGDVVVSGGTTVTTLGGTVNGISLQVNSGATLDLANRDLNLDTAAGGLTLGQVGNGVLSGVNGADVFVQGNVTVLNGSTIAPLITMTFDGTLAAQTFTPRPNVSAGHIDVANALGVNLVGNLGMESLLVRVGTTLTGVAAIVSASGEVDLQGTLTNPGGTLHLVGTVTRDFTTGANTIANLEIDDTAFVTALDNLIVAGLTDLEIGTTLRIVPGNTATFNGVVTLNGTLDICGDTTFNAALTAGPGSGTLTATSNNNVVIRFSNTAATTFNAGTTFTINPPGGPPPTPNFVDLRSSGLPGDDWNFQNLGGTYTIVNARVQDSTAVNPLSTTLPAPPALSTSTDLGGNNANWNANANWAGLTAADLVWLGGTSTDWTDPSNFDLNVLPIAGSTVTFRNLTANVPANVNSPTLDRIVVESSFNPTLAAAITLAADITLTNGFLLQDNGNGATIDLGTRIMSVRGTVSTLGLPINNGVLRFDGGVALALTQTRTLTLGASLQVNGAGTILDLQTSTRTLTIGGALGIGGGAELDINGPTGVTVISLGNLTVAGALDLANNNQVQTAGVTNTFAGGTTTFAGTSTFVANGAVNQTLNLGGARTFRNLTKNNAGVLTINGGDLTVDLAFAQNAGGVTLGTVPNATFTGNLTATAGTLTLGTSIVTAGANWTTTLATVTPGGSTVIFTGLGSTVNYGATTVFNNVTMNHGLGNTTLVGGNALAIGGALSLTGGGTLRPGMNGVVLTGGLTFPGAATLDLGTNNAPFTVAGNVDFSGGALTTADETRPFTLTGVGQTVNTNAQIFNALTVAPGASPVLASALDANGPLGVVTISGALNLNGFALTLGSDLASPLVGAGTLTDTPGNGRVDYSPGGGAPSLINVAPLSYPSDLVVSNAATAFQNTLPVTVARDMRVAGGDYDVLNTLTVSRNLDVATGEIITVANGRILTASTITGFGGTLTPGASSVISLTGAGSPLGDLATGITVSTLVGAPSYPTVEYAGPTNTIVRQDIVYGNLRLRGTGAVYDVTNRVTGLTLNGNLVFQSGAGLGVSLPANALSLTFQNGAVNSDSTITTAGGRLNILTLTINKQTSGVGDKLTLTDPSPTSGIREIQTLVHNTGTFSVGAKLRIVQGTVGQAAVGDQALFLVAAPNVELTFGDGANRLITIHDNMQLGFGLGNVQVVFATGLGTGSRLALAQRDSLLQFSGALTSKLLITTSGVGRGFIDAGTQFSAALLPDPGKGIRANNVQVLNNDASAVISPPAVLRPILATASIDLLGNINWDFQGGGFITALRGTALGDGKGGIDKVQIYFSGGESISNTSLANNHARFQLVRTDGLGTDLETIAGTASAVAQSPGSSGRGVVVTFGDGITGTGIGNVEVRYTPPLSSSGALLNAAGVPALRAFTIADVTSGTRLFDAADPTLVSVNFNDVDQNGGLDLANFLFSEPIRFTSGGGQLLGGLNPVTTTIDMGTFPKITLVIAGETLSPIQIDRSTPKTTGDDIATEIQAQVRSLMGDIPPGSGSASAITVVGHNPLNRPAYLNFTCTFENDRFVMRAGVPLVRNPTSGDYTQSFANATVSVISGGAADASPFMRLDPASGSVTVVGRGNGTSGISISAVILTPANTGLNGTTATLRINDEEFRDYAIVAGSEDISEIAKALENKVRDVSVVDNDPMNPAHTKAYTEFCAVPDAANGRLVLIPGLTGLGSEIEVASGDGNTFASTAGLGTASLGVGAIERVGTDSTDIAIEDLNILAPDGTNLLFGQTDADLTIVGGAATIVLTNTPNSGVSTPGFIWIDNGNQAFVGDRAGISNIFPSAITNLAGGSPIVILGDTDGDGTVSGNNPGPGVLDASQSVPLMGTTGNTVTFAWTPTGTNLATITGGQNSSILNFTTTTAGSYTFDLVVTVTDAAGNPVVTAETDGFGRLTKTITFVVVDQSPVALAGPDISVLATFAQLDGSNSFDPNGGVASVGFIWSATNQNNTVLNPSVFDSDSIANPVFTPTTSGVFTITLTVFKLSNPSIQSTDTIQVVINNPANLLPLAQAGQDIVVRVLSEVTLDGGASVDPEGLTLLFQWGVVSSPEPVTLSSFTDVRPTFRPAVPGSYVFRLTVAEGSVQSAPDTVTIYVIDDGTGSGRIGPAAAPLALGLRRSVFMTTTPTSLDTTPPLLVFADNIKRLATVVDLASSATGDSLASAVAGLYKVVIYSGSSLFAKVYFPTDVLDDLPISLEFANGTTALISQFGIAGEAFILDGGESVDDGGVTTFSWTQVSGPFVFQTNSGTPISVIPSVAGTYVFELVVVDNVGLGSFPRRISIPILPASILPPATAPGTGVALLAASAIDPTTGAGPPVAKIAVGGVTTSQIEGSTVHFGTAGTTLTLTSTNSINLQSGVPQAGGLTYRWKQIAGPTGLLTGEASASATVTTKSPAAGAYQFELTVTDGNGVSGTETIWITLGVPGSEVPVAVVATQETVILPVGGQPLLLTLNGSSSLGELLTYSWSQVQGVPTVVEGAEQGKITIRQPGTYTFNLQVSNASGVSSAPGQVTFRVRPAAEAPLESGGSQSKSSGGCSVTTGDRVGWEAWFLAFLLLGLLGLRIGRPETALLPVRR
ncbi:MAG: hypothetical protein JKY65_01000, partial [Planctomycetes bacterium]|nr:hypothetical protein [Planctomycetota bacterium]